MRVAFSFTSNQHRPGATLHRPNSVSRIVRRAIGAALLCTLPLGAAAETVRHKFELSISGFRAGTISTAAKKSGSSYSVSGLLSPSAFLRKLRDVGYKGSASGSVSGSTYKTRKYNGHTKTGSRNSVVAMRWKGGKPVVDKYEPKRAKAPHDIVPAKQTGTIDILTAAHIVFEDQSKATLCNKTIHMFDGRRRSKISLSKPKAAGDGFSCRGTYTRVAGYSAADLQKRKNFPFSLSYKKIGDDTYRLMSFSTKTTFGSAKAVRK